MDANYFSISMDYQFHANHALFSRCTIDDSSKTAPTRSFFFRLFSDNRASGEDAAGHEEKT